MNLAYRTKQWIGQNFCHFCPTYSHVLSDKIYYSGLSDSY